MPESFNVLIKELQGLALDVDLLTKEELENEKVEAEVDELEN
jgi:DNA-directed RNA polymerase subunit beta